MKKSRIGVIAIAVSVVVYYSIMSLLWSL